MWLYGGGLGVNATSEVWKSADGSSWSLVTDSAAWEVRNVWSAVAFDNRLWVLGGYAGKRTFRDVWWSYDGVAWVKVLEEAHWGGRFGARAVSFNNRLWVLGGSTTPCDEDGITACAGAVAESVCKGFWRDCHGNDAWSDAFATSNFVTLEASGSTTVVGADNSIGICAAMDRLLPAEAVFQVTGLDHVMPSGALVVQGRDWAQPWDAIWRPGGQGA
ncbi:hypothetical protein T484DRAFT_1842160 [Baffinella frigidus]|nr:hypothetical protein T484DRAFT_1842160 [Cryptophyta sp. CCMP2293]